MRLHPTRAAGLFALAGTLTLAASLLLAPDTMPEASIVGALGLEFFLGMLAITFASLGGSGVFQRLGLGPSRIPRVTSLVLVAGTLLLSFALNGVYELAGLGNESALAQFESDLSGTRGWTLAAAVISFALAPGFAEELLCRGLIQRGLHHRIGPAAAVGLAALFFGALHMEPAYVVLASILGAYLGVITLIGGSIRISILCHATNNFAAVLAAAWVLEIDPLPGGAATLVSAFALSAAALGWASRSLGGVSGAAAAGNTPIGLQPGSGSDDS